jgi:hypothetical protein
VGKFGVFSDSSVKITVKPFITDGKNGKSAVRGGHPPRIVLDASGGPNGHSARKNFHQFWNFWWKRQKGLALCGHLVAFIGAGKRTLDRPPLL